MPRIVGLVESAEVQQWLTEQEEGVMCVCVCGQTSYDCFCPFFRENLLRMRQRLVTFLGSQECTVHVIITPLYHYVIMRVIKHVPCYTHVSITLTACC